MLLPDTDDYLPVPLGDAEDFLSHGSRKTSDRAPGPPPGTRKQPSAQFEEYIKAEITPLIGLEYVTEYTTGQKNTPRYQCELCAATPQGASIVAHVISAKHRLNYMERKDPDRYQRITSMSQQKSFLTAEGLKYANEIEAREGRQLIKIEHNPQNVGPRIQDQDLRQKDEVDQSSDLFSRLTAYKQKIKEIEDKQKEKQYSDRQQAKTSADVAKEQRDEAKSLLKKQLNMANDPILGLEFLKAQPNPLKPSTIPFNCTLCGTQLGHHSSFIAHVVGLAHRLEYFKRRHHDLYLVCSKISNRSSQRKLVEEHSVELERQDGRGTLFIDSELIAGEDKETSQPSKAAQQPSDIEEVEMEEGFEEDASSIQAQLFDMVKNMDKVPLVGLRYVTETQSYNSYDPPKYKCSLCDVNVSKTFIITHLTGHQHRLEYIKKNYPELEKDATSDRDTLNNYCRDIENDIGREPVNVVMMRPPKDLNSPVTFSKPIPVKAPSKAEENQPQEPKNPPPQAPEPTPISIPTPAALQTRPEIQMSKLEKRAAALQEKIKNRDKLTPKQQEDLSRQLKNDGKKEDGSVFHFYDLIEEHESEPLLGLASCVEVWHPKDLEPPLFRCDICDFDTNFKHIVEHLMGKQHKMEYFKWMHPDVYQDIMRIGIPRNRDNFLRKMVMEFDRKHVRETIQYTVATDDSPWQNWKKNVNLMAYMRFDAKKREKKIGNETMAAESSPQFMPEPRQSAPEPVTPPEPVQPVKTFPADTRTAGIQQGQSIAQSDSVADMIDGSVINDEKWDQINAEIKKRIGEGRIMIKKDPAKFLKTYKPFLIKFPIIGLEWLSEFQLGDENADPWYLCRLCRSKITWSDAVDHVISIYHRMCFIQKEHPTLHELLKEEMWKPGGEREMNDKIEEFAKGIAKPPSEQTLEVLLEKVVKPDSRTPMKDYTSMAQRQGAGEQARPLDFDRGQGNQQQRAQGNQQSWGQRDQQSQELRSTGDNVAVQGQFKQAVKPQEPGVGTQGSEAPQMPLITGKQAARNARRAKLNKVPGAIARFPMLYGNACRQPLVGLEYLVEIQVIGEDHKKPEYVCELCDIECYTNVIQHMLGYKHRAAFFMAKYPDRQTGQISEQMAADYERQYGRGKVQVVREGKGAKKQRQKDAIQAKKEVRDTKKAFREHNLKEHQSLETVRVELEETKIVTPQPKEPQPTGQEYPEKETPASKRGLKITPGARPKFPTMFGSKATRALIGLEHLIEIQMVGEHKERRPNYLCELCDADVGPGSILQHLYGHKHRHKFISSTGRQESQVTENMAYRYEKLYGRGTVRVVVEDRQSRRIREKERQENLKDRKEQSVQGSTGTATQPIVRPAKPFQQTMPTATVTGPPPISSTVQPLQGSAFTGQQMSMVQEERFSPFPQQNLQPVQSPQPLMQLQAQPSFQQPGPIMQQQPTSLLQQQQQPQMIMQQGPPMMQVTQQPRPLMQQQPLHQPQMIQPTGFNVSVQQPQPTQIQPTQVIIQQPQMMSQMPLNTGFIGQHQNVSMGMPNMVPQQNIQMRPSGVTQPVSSQQGMVPNSQQMRPSGMTQPLSSQQGMFPNSQPMNRPQGMFPNSQPMNRPQGMVPSSQPMVRPQLGIPPIRNTTFERANNQRPPGFDRPYMNQQHLPQSQSSNVPSFSRPQNRQLTTVNIQKTNVNQTTADKPDNKESSQKSSQSNKKDPDLSSYRIPKKDSPRKGVQDTKFDDKNRGRNDSRDSGKPEDRTKRGTSDSRQSGGPARDDRRSSSSAGRHQDSRSTGDSRSGRSGSRDSKGSSSRRDRDRSPGSRKSDGYKYADHRTPEKDKTTGSKYADKKPSEKSSDRKQPSKDGDRSNSKTSDKPDGNKQNIMTGMKTSGSKNEDRKQNRNEYDRNKQVSERKDKFGERRSGSYLEIGEKETSIDKSKEKTEQGTASKTATKEKNEEDGKSKIDSSKLSDKPKSSENRAKEQTKSKVYDGKERDSDSRSKSSGSKSGSFIEIESNDFNKISKGKEASATDSCIINVDVVPKRKHERTESQDDGKSKQAKIAASPAKASSASRDRDKKESVNEKVKDIRPDSIDKQDKVIPTNVEIKIEPFKSPIKTPKGKLACAVTVDLVDISTLSQVELEELKQGSPQKETPEQSVVLEASSASLVQKPKIKEEILSPKVKIKEEIVSPQGKFKEARTEPKIIKGKQTGTKLDAVKVKQEVASPVSVQKAEAKAEPIKKQTVVRKDIWSVTDEWAANDAMDVDKEPRKPESKPADKVNIVVEVEVKDKSEKVEISQKESKAKEAMPGCSVTVEIGDTAKEPEAMEVDVSHKDDQRDEDNEQSDDDDDFIDFSEFVTLDEEGEVDDMAIGSINVLVEEPATSTPDKKESETPKRNRSRSRDRSRRSGQSDHRSPRRSRSRDRHGSRHDRARSRDRWSARSGRSGDGDSKRSGSSQGQSTHDVASVRPLQQEGTQDIKQPLEARPQDDVHKIQKPSLAQQCCPAKGCCTTSGVLKNHVYSAHIPKLFLPLEEQEQHKIYIHGRRLNGLQILAINFCGERSSIYDCVEYLNKNSSVPFLPETTDCNELQADMRALCKFAGWPVPDNFRVYQDINSPACLLYWRILLFLIDQLPEPERREFYMLHNKQDEENLGIEQHFESKPLDDIYQEQKPKSCPARGYPATIVWVKKEDIGKDKGQHNKAQQERKKMPVRCPVKGCTAASRNLKLNHAYPAHIPKVFHQLEEEERSNNDIHRKRLNGLQTLAVNFRGEGSSIDDCVDYLNKNLSLVIVQLTEVLDPQQAEMKALCEFAGWPVPESKFRVYPDINSPACLLYWRILLFLIEQLPEPEKTEFYTLYPLIGKGFFRRGKNAVVKLDGVKKAEEKQDDVKKAEGKQDDVKEAEIKQDDVKKAEGKQDDVKKAEEKRDGVKKSEEKQDGVKKAEEKQDDEKGTSRVSDAESRSPRRDKTLSTSKSGTASDGRSGTNSSTSKATTRTTVEVELSDTSTKSDVKSQKPDSDKSEEGLVASSRALLKEKAKSSSGSRAKSNQCSVEIGVVEDSPKPEKANDSETKDSDKQTDEGQSRSRRQTRSQKPKCEVSIVID